MDDSSKTELWRRRFFEAQAAAEEFILGTYGEPGIDSWIRSNAAITARLLHAEVPDAGRRAAHFIDRLHRQLSLYDSDITRKADAAGVTLVNAECGILKYRKRAEERGVKLTFTTPCDYCQKLNRGIYRQYTGADDIHCRQSGAGCVWKVGDV